MGKKRHNEYLIEMNIDISDTDYQLIIQLLIKEALSNDTKYHEYMGVSARITASHSVARKIKEYKEKIEKGSLIVVQSKMNEPDQKQINEKYRHSHPAKKRNVYGYDKTAKV